MGSLFVPVSFAVLLVASNPPSNVLPQELRSILALVGVLLYSWWLLTVQLSTRVMHDIDVDIMVLNEGRIDLDDKLVDTTRDGLTTLTREIFGARSGRGVLMKVRRNHWLFYLPLLIIPATYVILGP
jgi:hypothetical protein